MSDIEFPLQFTRQYSGPLDSTSVFDTYSDLVTYVNTNGTSYPGQLVTVLATSGTYVIGDDGSTILRIDTGEFFDSGLVSVDTLCATEIHTISSFTHYQDILVSELSGFNVTGDISVNGEVGVAGLLSANKVNVVGGSSDQWNSTYSSVNTTSANWDSTYTTVSANSAVWNGDFSNTKIYITELSAAGPTNTISITGDLDLNGGSLLNVGNNSITFESGASISSSGSTILIPGTLSASNLVSNTGFDSGAWDSTYTTVSANSAQWAIDTVYDDTPVTELQAASGSWDSTYTTVSANSASWESRLGSLETDTHTHTNKAVLDGTTAPFTTEQETKLAGITGTNTGDQDLSGLQPVLAEGAFVDGDKTKLDGIADGATKGGTKQNATSNAITPTLDTKSGSVAGNARGNEALDTQMVRTAATQVASGARSIILGGIRNTASAAQSSIINATDSNATGTGAVVIGGDNNTSTGLNSEVLGSQNSAATGIGSSVVGGSNCNVSGNWGITVGGLNHQITQPRSGILAGNDNTVNHINSVILGGSNITTDAADTAFVPNLNVGGSLKMPTGATDGYVLKTDANGVGTWQAPYGDTNVTTYLSGNLDTHIIPDANEAYDLGSPDYKFRSLYVSASTIYMGPSSTPVSLEDGRLSVGGDVVAQSPAPQAITPLSAYEAPAPYTIDLAQCMNAEIILTSNMSFQLIGAEKGQSGMLVLGNGNAHDGVGFTVDFYPDNVVSQTHTQDGHSVMAGDLADFAVAPAAGEYNYGTIGWYYTGTEYLLYVSEVKPYTDSIEP